MRTRHTFTFLISTASTPAAAATRSPSSLKQSSNCNGGGRYVFYCQLARLNTLLRTSWLRYDRCLRGRSKIRYTSQRRPRVTILLLPIPRYVTYPCTLIDVRRSHQTLPPSAFAAVRERRGNRTIQSVISFGTCVFAWTQYVQDALTICIARSTKQYDNRRSFLLFTKT